MFNNMALSCVAVGRRSWLAAVGPAHRFKMGRMNKRMSLAPSVIMATTEEPPEGHNAIKEFFISHIKTLVTIFMIFGTIAVIVVIVMGKLDTVSMPTLPYSPLISHHWGV